MTSSILGRSIGRIVQTSLTGARSRQTRWVGLCLCLLALTAFATGALASPGGDAPPSAAGRERPRNHRPGEMIVRFRDNSLLSETAARLSSAGQPFQSLTGDSNLDGLNVGFKVRSFRRLFDDEPGPALRQGEVTAESARALLRERDAAREARLGRLRTRFPRRSARAATAPVPSLAGLYRVEFEDPGTDVPAACAAYARDPQVLYAQPNHLNQLSFTPDDPYFSSAGSWGQPHDDLWGLKKLDPEPAWELTRGEGVTVAVLDTGIDYNHPDIRDNVLRDGGGNIVGRDFSDGDADPMDTHGHGTHVAGTIAATGDNGAGVIGVAPLARIMPLKIFDNATDLVCAEAIRYAADHGADVLNNSWGPSQPNPSNPLLEEAVAYAHALGCVVVFAAGNDGADIADYSPNNHPAAIAVGATDQDDLPLAFSNYGPGVAVSAPGGGSGYAGDNYRHVNILSLRASGTDMYRHVAPGLFTVGEDCFRSWGTSMAAPHVSGVAALLAALHPDWTNDRIAGQIIGSTDPVDAVGVGSGRVNAFRALTAEPRPNLKRIDSRLDDDRPGNRVNGVPDAGETLGLILGLKNVWLGAGDVRARLISLGPWVTVQDADAAYGAVGSGETKDNAADPFVLTLSAEAPLGESCRFEIEITADGHVSRSSYEFRLDLPPKPGWPVALKARPWHSDENVVLADLDRDGAEEILLAGDRELYVFRGDGSPHAPWPLPVSPTPDARILEVAAGDIDGDADLEIVVLVHSLDWVDGASIRAFHQESGLPVAGWPVIFRAVNDLYTFAEELALADVDCDGVTDVVVFDGNASPWVGVFRGNGTALPGWPVGLPGAPSSSDGGFVDRMSLAVGDLDGGWRPEIVVSVFRATPGTDAEIRPNVMWVLHADGRVAAGWPRTVQGGLTDPVLASLDGSPGLEIVVGEELPAGSRTHAYKIDGSEIPGWPVVGPIGMLAAADLEGDGSTEVVVNGGSLVSAIDASGGVRRWPLRDGYTLGAPSIADVDGDGRQEIVLSLCSSDLFGYCRRSRLAVLTLDGPMAAGFPSGEMSDEVSQPVVGDIDGDGRTDFVLFVWEEGKPVAFTNHLPFTSPAGWSQYRGSATRDAASRNGLPPATVLAVTDEGVFTRNASTLSAAWTFSHGGADADRFRYAIGSARGSSDIAAWKSVGLRRSAVRSDLALVHGKTYFFSVRALLEGLPPFETSADGITADLRKPIISRQTPAACTVGEEPVFRALVTDDVSGVKNVTLRVRVKGQSRFGAPRAMTFDPVAGEYTARLPRQKKPKSLEYNFTARDRAGNVRKSPTYTLRVKAP